jgi:opacity protein-like surface antigen
MQKLVFGAILAFLGASAPALAADLGGPDSPMNGHSTEYTPTNSWSRSGFYVTGTLGIANGDREISRTVTRDVGLELNTIGADPDDVQDFSDALSAASVPHTVNADNLFIPLIADKLSGATSDEFDSLVFGGEVSYLYQLPQAPRFALEVALGATFYDDAASSQAYAGAVGAYTGGTAAADFSSGGFDCSDIGTCAGDPSFYSQSGFVKFDRDYDIDLIGRAHYFLTERFAINAGVGVSWAQASVSGASTVDGTYEGLNTKFDKDTSSIGYVLTAGANYWITDNIVLGVAYDYKRHTFDVNTSASDSFDLGGGNSLIGGANDSVDITDDVHTIKARIGIKLN